MTPGFAYTNLIVLTRPFATTAHQLQATAYLNKLVLAVGLSLALGPPPSYTHRPTFGLQLACKCSGAHKHVPKNYFCMQKIKNHLLTIQKPCHESGRLRCRVHIKGIVWGAISQPLGEREREEGQIFTRSHIGCRSDSQHACCLWHSIACRLLAIACLHATLH